MEIRIGRTYTFEAAHDLPNHLGKCKQLHGHGYKLEVVIKLAPGFSMPDSTSPEWGMIMDFGRLDEVMNDVLVNFDHSHLNNIIPNPTAENIVRVLSDLIENRLPLYARIHKVKLWETERAYAEVVRD